MKRQVARGFDEGYWDGYGGHAANRLLPPRADFSIASSRQLAKLLIWSHRAWCNLQRIAAMSLRIMPGKGSSPRFGIRLRATLSG
jgi:hypothetical protein